jgi:hypothetical protein
MRLSAACLAVLMACLVACQGSRSTSPPPRAEFLLSSADSTFWVSTIGGETRVRGAPLMLARYDGRFYELYTADDDYSYNDALLVGQHLYRRDIASGDSTLLFADTAVARVAAAYARAHPGEQPLDPDEEGEANPSTTATAEVDVLGIFGPYVSFEYHVDYDLPRHTAWHATRRGVIDLRTSKEMRLEDLFGEATGRRLESDGRRRYEATRDSILSAAPSLRGDDRRAADALLRLRFDERSFTLSELDGEPAVAFDVPGQGEGPAGRVVELDAVKVSETPWWHDIRSTFPLESDDGSDVWTGAGYRVFARYDTSGESARLTLADSLRKEWPLGAALAPLERITWIDRPAITTAERNALVHAFNSAASYDETSRVAARPVSADTRFQLTQLTHTPAHATNQDRSRKPARNVRAHDARAREQHGTRVRRRHSFDDGQDRGDRRVSSQSRVGGYRVDRPRGLSRADSSRRSRRHEGERQLRWAVINGSRRPR